MPLTSLAVLIKPKGALRSISPITSYARYLDVDERLHYLDVCKAVLFDFQYTCKVPTGWIKSAYRPSYELLYLGVLFSILNVEQIFLLVLLILPYIYYV